MFIVMVIPIIVSAQYKPNTKWPYLNEAFQHGTIFLGVENKSEADINIHLVGNVLHYISEDGRILEIKDKNVSRIEIGNKAYIPIDKKMMELICAKGEYVLLKLEKADFDAMSEGTGAYGASLNSSSSKDLSSLNIGGMNNPKLGEMLQQRHEGRDIPMQTKYYFLCKGKLLDANKNSVETIINDENKTEWKNFLKKNKVKWKNEKSLVEVLDFIIKQYNEDVQKS